MSKVVVLYGEMGAGKNYQGERLAKEMGATFLDGDDVLPPKMAERVRKFKPLTPEMLNDYIHGVLYSEIAFRTGGGRHLVVGQALYRQENRDRLKQQLEYLGLEVEYRLVKVPFLQNLRQLWSRPRGALWVLYWLLNKPFFQA